MSYYGRGGYGRGGYGRGGSYRRRSSGGRVRRTLKADLTMDGTNLATEQMSIPVDSTKNVGIQIHEFRVHFDDDIPVIDKHEHVWLNRNTPTTERHMSDIDYICGVARYCATPVGYETAIYKETFNPPIPIFQDEIRLCGLANTGAQCDVWVEVSYSLAWLSVGQIIGIAKNIII